MPRSMDGDQFRQPVGVGLAIGISKGKQFATGERDTDIPCRVRKEAVRALKKIDVFKERRDLGCACFWRTIDHDNFKIAKGLLV